MLTHSRRGAPAMRQVAPFLLRHWRAQRPFFVAALVCSGLATLADVLVPLFAGRLVDAVSLPRSTPGALRAAEHAFIAMCGLGVLLLALQSASIFSLIRLTLAIMPAVVRDAFWRVQRFSTSWHSNAFAGSVVRKITRGANGADLMNDTVILGLFPATMAMTGATIILGWRWPMLGVALACGSAITIAVMTAGSFWTGIAARLANSWDTRLSGALADAITCNAVVKAFGAEAEEDRRLARIVAKWRLRFRRTWLRGTYVMLAHGFTLLGLRGFVTGLALYLWWAGRAGPGDLTMVLATYFVLHGYLQNIGQHIRNLRRAVNDMEELVALHDPALPVEDRADGGDLHVPAGEIVFDRVQFRYGDHLHPLFDDLSVTVHAGERVGLVGHSGSGKTSFVRLLQRLHNVSGGRILIDGQDIARITQSSLRQQIAIVPQEPILFHRSLAENIGYSHTGAVMEEIERAARLANAHDFITRLPDGYRTLVGERGVKLSGGERQRVAIARAFLADAPILVLDEATASLDSESEAAIQQAMQRLMQGRTALVIAHRLSTIRAMDRILVFDRGRIVEQGDHAALLQRPGGVYRRLFEHQAVGMLVD